ncbi:hypothetical protein C8F01DRAFT_523098 [Mycena amicta]|nr:hypothetical protein C8F01DRAFT_523098 [Mycena amicta]
MILQLPTDVLILILHQLTVLDLSVLSETCQYLHALVDEYGWNGYLRQHPRPSMSLFKSRQTWSAKATAIYDFLSDECWSRAELIARPLAESWPGKQQPLLALSASRLIVAAGHTIFAYAFSNDASIALEGSCSLENTFETANWITALSFFPDGTLCVAFHDGTFESLEILDNGHDNNATLNVQRSTIPSLQLRNKDFIESLSSHESTILSLSSTGRATLMNKDTFTSSTTLDLNARSWTSHLCMDASSPFAAFGTSSSTPLAIHSVSHDEISPQPTSILSLAPTKEYSRFSAVYGITRGPPCAWGASPQIVVAGWYNGYVSVHDLRSSSRDDPPDSSTSNPSHLRPVITLNNSWSDEPIYSVSCGGGNGSYVASGAARHSLVSVWDVRNPTGGFSVHAPMNDRSPVYSLIMESSRLFGATESRPFVLDFGPGVTETTYPTVHPGVTPSRLNDSLSRNHSIGFYVTKYAHQAVSSRLAIA